jgi:ParB family chromosome partitioning protein
VTCSTASRAASSATRRCCYGSPPRSSKLEATADAVRAEGWGWVEVQLDVDPHALRQFSPAEYDLRKPTPDGRKELAELARRSSELERQGDALGERHEGWADEAEAIYLEEQDIAARQRSIQHGLRVWAPAVTRWLPAPLRSASG